jgi:NADP-dependent 3-hydroxy acid dehydrogenase YdfG
VIVVVTGATGETGRAVCAALLAAGHTVIAIGSDELRLGEVNASWRYVCDLTDAAETGLMARAIHDKEGGVDALVHLVGGWRGGNTDDDWNWLEPRILTTLRLASLALMPDLSESEDGRLIVIGSTSATRPSWSGANYSVLKAAASAWVSAVASGWRKAGKAAAVELLVQSIGGDGTPVEVIAARVTDLMTSAAADLNGARIDLSGASASAS